MIKQPNRYADEAICRRWITNPELDPKTRQPITPERKEYFAKSCKWNGLSRFNPQIEHMVINNQMRSHEDRYVMDGFTIKYRDKSGAPVPINYGVYAVIDGHNGKTTADWIKGNLMTIVKGIVNRKMDIGSSQNIRGIISQTMTDIRTGIREKIRDDSGAVMCMMMICQNHYAFGWIGDARGVVFGRTARGQVNKIYQTIDHNFQTDATRIKNDGGVLVKDHAGVPRLGMLNIPRAFGDKQMANVPGFSSQFEVSGEYKFEPAVNRAMYIILGSDGFWHIYNQPTNKKEILRNLVVKFNLTEGAVLERFIKTIRGRANENDDITIIRVKISLN